MSTASLPNYLASTFSRIPSYSAEPQAYEQRVAQGNRLLPQPSGNFVKQTKNGDLRLRLNAQENSITLPVYGYIQGRVELSKTRGVTSVEVKIEGRLRLQEIAEGGTTSVDLCPDTMLLWIKNPNNTSCPSTLPFSLNLPATFSYEGTTYPLPPTYSAKLNGLPGFSATVDYSICTIINKPHSGPRLSFFGISGGNRTVSTPFIYCPRTRPTVPIPRPLLPSQTGFAETSEWQSYESVIHVKAPGGRDITTKLYIPASRTFCISQPIPFHLTFSSSSFVLASFLPFGPTVRVVSTKQPTRVQLIRQSTVDVRNTVILGTKADIWRIDTIGEGAFKHARDGPNWISFSGEIVISDEVKVPGFQAGGLTVKDGILLSMTPSDPSKSPFSEFRQIVPVRLTTDAWIADGTGIGADNPFSVSESRAVDPQAT